jgi:hypothetical protein
MKMFLALTLTLILLAACEKVNDWPSENMKGYASEAIPTAPGNLVVNAFSVRALKLNWVDKSTNEQAFVVLYAGTPFILIE